MSKIQQRLETLFNEHRIIIWYDDNGALKDEYDNLELKVEKLEVNNNEFGIKYKVLYEEKEKSFLIYSYNPEPKLEDNWLLDIELNFYKFSADAISMIVQELDLDVSKKEFISEHKNFFNAKSRSDKFKTIITKDDSDDDFILKMCSIVIAGDETLEDILLTLISKPNKYSEIGKYNLDKKLWQIVSKKYRYQSTTPSIDDFIYQTFQNHFYGYIDNKKCELNKEAKLFIKSWMDSSRYNELFEKTSKKVENDLNIQTLFNDYTLNNILECDTYEKCEQFIIVNLREKILNKEFSIKQIQEIIDIREHKFWYNKYQNIYHTFKYAVKLLDVISKFDLKISDFEDGIKEYQDSWYKVDYYYRNFIYYFNKAEHSEIVKTLTQVEDAYLNSYLRPLNDKWQEFVQDYSINTINHQRRFYDTKVVPIVEKKQKAFVIISDALRYECAVELGKIIGYDNTESRSFNVQTNSMISSLPSYTQLGMASLLPHDSLEIKDKDDSVYVDGKSSKGKEARQKILKQKNPNSSTISDEAFLALSRNNGREFVKANDIIYIYHNEIDSTGDDAISEEKVFDAVKSSFETIKRIVKQVANLNGTNILVTADHGFIYTNKPTQDSEFCKLDTSMQDTIKVNRRFVIGKDLDEDSCVSKFEGKNIGIDGDNDFLITKSINKIRKQGGGNRFVHGGASLQELVIPLLEIKYVRKNVNKDTDISILPISTITTNSLNVSVYQEEAVTTSIKPSTFNIGFYSSDDILISDENKITLDSKDKENRNRETKLKFNFKEIANKYNNQYIKLVVKKVLENSSVQSIDKTIDVKLQLSFFNDFDEF